MFFVDFGNKQKTAISELQPVPSQLTELSAQAIPISLFNITSHDNRSLAKEFRSLTNEVLLTAICISVDGQ